MTLDFTKNLLDLSRHRFVKIWNADLGQIIDSFKLHTEDHLLAASLVLWTGAKSNSTGDGQYGILATMRDGRFGCFTPKRGECYQKLEVNLVIIPFELQGYLKIHNP